MTISIYRQLWFNCKLDGSNFNIFKILQTVLNILWVSFLFILNAKLTFQPQSSGLIVEFSYTTVFLQLLHDVIVTWYDLITHVQKKKDILDLPHTHLVL